MTDTYTVHILAERAGSKYGWRSTQFLPFFNSKDSGGNQREVASDEPLTTVRHITLMLNPKEGGMRIYRQSHSVEQAITYHLSDISNFRFFSNQKRECIRVYMGRG